METGFHQSKREKREQNGLRYFGLATYVHYQETLRELYNFFYSIQFWVYVYKRLRRMHLHKNEGDKSLQIRK